MFTHLRVRQKSNDNLSFVLELYNQKTNTSECYIVKKDKILGAYNLSSQYNIQYEDDKNQTAETLSAESLNVLKEKDDVRNKWLANYSVKSNFMPVALADNALILDILESDSVQNILPESYKTTRKRSFLLKRFANDFYLEITRTDGKRYFYRYNSSKENFEQQSVTLADSVKSKLEIVGTAFRQASNDGEVEEIKKSFKDIVNRISTTEMRRSIVAEVNYKKF